MSQVWLGTVETRDVEQRCWCRVEPIRTKYSPLVEDPLATKNIEECCCFEVSKKNKESHVSRVRLALRWSACLGFPLNNPEMLTQITFQMFSGNNYYLYHWRRMAKCVLQKYIGFFFPSNLILGSTILVNCFLLAPMLEQTKYLRLKEKKIIQSWKNWNTNCAHVHTRMHWRFSQRFQQIKKYLKRWCSLEFWWFF